MHLDSVVTALDLLSTFAFAIVGARIAASRNMDYGGITLIAATASISGGLLRDVLCQVEPVLLHRETIGTSCFAGALVYVSLYHLSAPTIVSVLVGGAVVVLVRELSIKFNLNLPKIK